VACGKLRQLGQLMRSIYGKQAGDVAIVAKDHSFDPTQVLKAPPADFPAAPSVKTAAPSKQSVVAHVRKDVAEDKPVSVMAKHKAVTGHRRAAHVGGGQSAMGEMIHKMNEEELAPVRKRATLASLSHSLGGVLGW